MSKETSARAAKLGAQFLRMSIEQRVAYMAAKPYALAKALGTICASVVAQREKPRKR